MAVTSKSYTKADDAPAAKTTKAEPEKADTDATDPRECVVNEDFHVGRATPGSRVCSYHAMHYAADGSKRV